MRYQGMELCRTQLVLVGAALLNGVRSTFGPCRSYADRVYKL